MIHLIAIALFNPFYRWMGRESSVRVYQVAMMLWPLIVCFYPLLNAVARQVGEEGEEGEGVGGVLFWAVTLTFFFVWSFAGWCWT